MPLPESESFNIQFVQMIEGYRCLYDKTLPQYGSKDEQDKAWSLIAQRFQSTSAECKIRWKYLRGGLTRYSKKLKETLSDPTSKQINKPFYLWDVMQFILPFLKTRDRSEYQPFSSANHSLDTDDVKDECGYEADSFDDVTCQDIQETSPRFPVVSEPSFQSRTARKRFKTEASEAFTDKPESLHATLSEQLVREMDNPDLQFFRSILPDVAQFNPSQKRQFKMRVLQLIEEMSYGNFSSGLKQTNSSFEYPS